MSESGGEFLSMAEGNIELVITRLPSLVSVTLRGPVTRGSLVECPPHGEWLAIRFRLGAYFPTVPTAALMNHQCLDMPLLGVDRFWFGSDAFEIPTFDNAELLVSRIALAGLISRDSAADAAMEGDVRWLSRRSVQRHFRRTTGMTFNGYRQIERAREAASMLVGGNSILSTAFDAGYFDQAHLTRSMKRLIGTTPAVLLRDRPQLSFSYKTTEA